jgi:2-polyprenyl-3-methyl-5-hydroxy-6-metoxy-1,4-benzoquinol methylase
VGRQLGYNPEELATLPQGANLGLGCGNPTALLSLREGETVLDLGSGAGIDCFLAAKKVGANGRVIGVDMTPEMIEKARANGRAGGYANVEFRLGEIEHLPVSDRSVDVIISNCVINLSADKDRVLHEAFRVLKPGGRFAVSDIVTRGEIDDGIRKSVLLWAGCMAGALDENDYHAKLAAAGFEHIGIEATRVYLTEDAKDLLGGAGLDADTISQADGKFMSAFVRAAKPKDTSSKSCCAPTCCN